MVEETRLYIKCMEEVRDRVNLVTSVVTQSLTTGHQVFDIELVFLQFRKILELIAFASLTANKKGYSTTHAKFATHWRAKGMLQELEKINKDFYPMPVGQPQLQANGVKHLPAMLEGYLSKDDFEFLYDKTSEIIHVRNPFSPKDPTVKIKYSTKEWVTRIQALLAFHIVHLLDGKKWIVQVPGAGSIHVYPAEPRTTATV